MSENPKQACGDLKPPMHLIPPAAEVAESIVLGLGAKKYTAFNWREDRIRLMTYVAAIKRHLAAWVDGEDTDSESGQSHIAHVRACTAIMLDSMTAYRCIDDRPIAGAAPQMIADLSKPIASKPQVSDLEDETETEVSIEVPCECVDCACGDTCSPARKQSDR